MRTRPRLFFALLALSSAFAAGPATAAVNVSGGIDPTTGLTTLGWVVSRDHNRPRVLYLALISGAMFADRRRWGGDSVDPLGEVRHDD